MEPILGQSLRRVDRTTTRCLVCGCSEVRTDEVVDRGWVLLNECPRCDHRWTHRAEAARPRTLRIAREVASAA